MLVDDDPFLLAMMVKFLTEAGYAVDAFGSPAGFVDAVSATAPDVVLLDIMMPGADGLEICRQLRERPHLDNTKIIMVSAKTYDFDRRRARSYGSNGFIAKPIQRDAFLERIAAVIDDRVDLRFSGCAALSPFRARRPNDMAETPIASRLASRMIGCSSSTQGPG